jgi:hypothetical protein
MNEQRPNDHAQTPAEIERNLRLFVAPGAVTEVRVLGAPRAGIVSGYFDDLAKATAAALVWSGRAEGVHFVLNPVNPALLARADNRLKDWAKHTTTDRDVTRRLWFFIDIDPVRPSGISSTEEEHQAALALARKIQDWLRTRGWPEPVLCSSGNGAHLLYRIELDNDDEATRLLERCLLALDKEFSDKEPVAGVAVAVDTTTSNAGRMTKCYGTMACKGDPTTDRPHRPSRVMFKPEHVLLVPVEKLRALAGSLTPQPAATVRTPPGGTGTPGKGTGGGDRSRLKVEEWLSARNVGFHRKAKADGKGRTVWVLQCPFDEGHGKDSCVMQAPDGAMSAKCLHNSCRDRGWQAFKEKIGKPSADHYDPPLSGSGGKRRRRKQGPNGAAIILDYFKGRYRPVFKRGNAVHCADGSALAQLVACGVPDSPLIDRLARASDAPRTAEGGVKWGALPKFFASQARVAWGDLLNGLPDEDGVAQGDDAPAREEFRCLVRDALLSEVVLGEVIKGTHATQTERRSLIDWCGKFAKPGPWRSVRSKRCWCRLQALEGGEVELQVAVRHELFGQLKADKRLVDMTAAAFARRAKRYQVGSSTREERPHGLAAVVLDPAFVRELTAGGPVEPDQPDQPDQTPERQPGEEG